MTLRKASKDTLRLWWYISALALSMLAREFPLHSMEQITVSSEEEQGERPLTPYPNHYISTYTDIVRRNALIYRAVKERAYDKFISLMDDPINQRLVSHHSWQLLKHCVKKKYLDVATTLITRYEADPNTTDPATGISLIGYAARTVGDDTRVLELLFGYGADITVSNNCHGEILREMIRDKKVKKAKTLITAGLPVDGLPEHTRPPLLEALHNHDVMALELLLHHDADPNRRHPVTGETPLITLSHIANQQQSIRLTTLLLTHNQIDLFAHDLTLKSAYEHAYQHVLQRRGSRNKGIRRARRTAQTVLLAIKQAIVRRLAPTLQGLRKSRLPDDIITYGIMPFLGRF